MIETAQSEHPRKAASDGVALRLHQHFSSAPSQRRVAHAHLEGLLAQVGDGDDAAHVADVHAVGVAVEEEAVAQEVGAAV
jgi:hypothetical protein